MLASPDSEALRLRALQASWRRGRWVAGRRLAWRWVLWYGQKPAVWSGLVVIGLAVLWWALQGGASPPADALGTTQAPPDAGVVASDMEAPTVLLNEGGLPLRWTTLSARPPTPTGLLPPAAPDTPIALQFATQLSHKEPQ